jgi:hypothetical protein
MKSTFPKEHKMTKHIVFRILAGLVLLAAIAGIAFFAFNAGVVHGTALNVQAPAAVQPEKVPGAYPYGYGMPFHHPFPFFGFGCFGLLIPLFLLFLAFAAMRHMIWGPRWGHHMHGMHHGPWGDKGPWDEGVPPMFAEWHRRAHETPTDDQTNPDKK